MSLPLEIELPDGTILEAPDGADPSTVAKAYLSRQQQQTTAQPQQTQQPNQSMPAWQQRTQAGMRRIAESPLTRQAALGVQGVGKGLLNAFAIAPAADALAGAANMGLSAAGSSYRFPNTNEAIAQTGLPQPETTSEKVADFGAQLLTGGMAGAAMTRTVLNRMGLPQAARTAQVAPTVEQLRTQSRNAYQASENAGVLLSRDSVSRVSTDLQSTLAKEGLDAGVHPAATAALKRAVTDLGDDISLEKLDTLRKVMRGAAASQNPDERRLAQLMIEKLDDYVSAISEQDVVAGAAKKGGESLVRARDLWSRSAKGAVIEDLFEGARNRTGQYSVSGMENALRTEFRALAQNNRQMRFFTPAEKDAIQKVARGGPVENAMRLLGKLAVRGPISGTVAVGGGMALGGPFGAGALMTAGEAGKYGAAYMTSRNASRAGELMRTGGKAANYLTEQLPPGYGVMRNALAPTVGAVNSLYDDERRR